MDDHHNWYNYIAQYYPDIQLMRNDIKYRLYF